MSAQPTSGIATDTAPTRIAYGAAPEQYGELRLPAGRGPFPIAVVVHGGCFLASMATTQYMSAFADSLRRAGIATWNIEYRSVDSPGGGWPETYRDVGRAADNVRVLARRFPLDTTRVIAIGHSAGGFLALWLGGRATLSPAATLYTPKPVPLRAVVALGADGDLPPIGPVLRERCKVPVAEQLLGADSSTRHARRAQANPVDMPQSSVPQLLVAGDKDPFETPALREAYAARARAKGETVDVIVLPGAGHFDVINPKAAMWPTIRDALTALVQGSR
jgi:acetyl esterase/lipase